MSKPERLITTISQALMQRDNCIANGNTLWKVRTDDRLLQIQKELLPSGSGIDSGCTIDLDRSTPEKIVIHTSFHHMNEGGFYDGWTEHTVILTPSFAFSMNIRITGRNRNDIKDYLTDVFSCALNDEYVWSWDEKEEEYRFTRHEKEVAKAS